MVRKIMSDSNPPRLLSFTLDGWPVLGGPVTISLNDGVAVLVGRNGAGKSAILEGFSRIVSFARNGFKGLSSNGFIHENIDENIPKLLEIKLLTPTNRQLVYKYEIIKLPAFVQVITIHKNRVKDNTEEMQLLWSEFCQYADDSQEALWIAKDGVTTIYKNNVSVYSTNSLIQSSHSSQKSLPELPDELYWVRSVLGEINLLDKYPIRSISQRIPLVLRFEDYSKPFHVIDLGNLSSKFRRNLRYTITNQDQIKEFENVCQRIGIVNKISEKKFLGDDEYLSEILFDGINVGLLSDGTLRILSILLEILNSNLDSTLIIEEPETQIHSGMLEKLLNEIESYTYGKNLILSTHSPQVVSWTQPDKINLVYRQDGQTFVRKLGADEIHNVADYLNEEGDLGDWIYSGILDE
jgi:predicted ATP-dependent endonuclease of OLD family